MQTNLLKKENITLGENLQDLTKPQMNVEKEVRKLNKALEKSSKEKSDLKTEIHDQAMRTEYLRLSFKSANNSITKLFGKINYWKTK